MKAIRVHRFGGPEVLQLDDVADPVAGPGQVLVRVRAAGVNPVDTYIRSGAYTFQPPLPYTPGIDAAGDVEAVGADVKRVRVGDRIYTAGSVTGAYAEKTVCHAAQVYPLPDTLSYAQGAAIGVPYGTAHRALFGRGGAQYQDWVLVHGASGGVGLAAIHIGRAAGLRVIGTAGSEEGLALIREHGAIHAFNHHDAHHLDQCREVTGGRGVDVMLEMLANVNLGTDLSCLAPKGRVVVIGSRGSVEIDARHLMTRDTDIRGMSLMNVTNEERDAIHAALRGGFEDSSLVPVVAKEYALSDVARAQRDVIESSTFGKLVLIP